LKFPRDRRKYVPRLFSASVGVYIYIKPPKSYRFLRLQPSFVRALNLFPIPIPARFYRDDESGAPTRAPIQVPTQVEGKETHECALSGECCQRNELTRPVLKQSVDPLYVYPVGYPSECDASDRAATSPMRLSGENRRTLKRRHCFLPSGDDTPFIERSAFTRAFAFSFSNHNRVHATLARYQDPSISARGDAIFRTREPTRSSSSSAILRTDSSSRGARSLI